MFSRDTVVSEIVNVHCQCRFRFPVSGCCYCTGWLPDDIFSACGVSFHFRYPQVFNWSGTHSVIAKKFLRPESTAEVADIIKDAHASGQQIRVVGNALSPNGIGLSDGDTMLSMVCCDKVLIFTRGYLRKGMCRVRSPAEISSTIPNDIYILHLSRCLT